MWYPITSFRCVLELWGIETRRISAVRRGSNSSRISSSVPLLLPDANIAAIKTTMVTQTAIKMVIQATATIAMGVTMCTVSRTITIMSLLNRLRRCLPSLRSTAAQTGRSGPLLAKRRHCFFLSNPAIPPSFVRVNSIRAVLPPVFVHRLLSF
jgi:hypothetical protein